MNFPTVIFSRQIDHALGWTVLHSIWQITLIALATGVLLFALRGRAAALRYRVANAALLAVVLTAAATFFWQMHSQKPQFFEAKRAWETLQNERAENTAEKVPPQNPGVFSSPKLPPRAQTASAKTWEDYFFEHQPLLVLLWLLGLVLGIFRLLGHLSFVQVLRSRMNFRVDPFWEDTLGRICRRAGFVQKIDLLESALVRSPLTVGFLKPAILFPIGIINRLSEAEVEAILAHELAHITRHDYLFNLLQSLVETLFYYHPAVWWLSAQVRNERESACDDLAIGWLGNRLGYAKALVAMQEMAHFPQTQALVAFAGTHRGQLLGRVQRLFSPQKFKVHIMEKWIATLLVACSLVALAVAQHTQVFAQNFSPNPTETPANGPNTGVWQAEFFNDSVCLNLSSGSRGNSWTNGNCYRKSAFPELAATPGDINADIKRPAGTLNLTGKIEGAEGYGKFRFVPDEGYLAALRREGITVTEEHLMFQLFWADFPLDYVSSMRGAGFRDLDEDMLMQLAVFKIDVAESRKLADLAKKFSNDKVSTEQLVQLKIANVNPQTIENYAKAGLGNLDLEAVANLSMQDVDPAYIEKMNGLGFGKLDAEEILAAKIHGITPEYVAEMTKLGLEKVGFEQILAMKIHDLNPTEIQKMQSLGLGNLDFDQMMSMKIHGVDADFIQKANTMGLGKLDADELVSLKIHGIDADFVKKANAMGFGKLELDDVMSMKIHGIDADFVQKANAMGLGKLELDDLMTMKIHQITPEFAQPFRDMGFKNLTLDDLTNARIFQVTPDFIRQAEKKGYKFPKLEEYGQLKVRAQRFGQ